MKGFVKDFENITAAISAFVDSLPTTHEMDANWEKLPESPDSLVHWLTYEVWVLCAKRGITMPTTDVVAIPNMRDIMKSMDTDPEGVVEKLKEVIPAMFHTLPKDRFIRSGLYSGKFDYSRSCFVPAGESVPEHFAEIIYGAMTVGCTEKTKYLLIREFIKPKSRQTLEAYRGMPISAEYRVFAKDGAICGIVEYWPGETPDLDFAVRKQMYEETPLDPACVDLARDLSRLKPDRAWSFDFMPAEEGGWVFIDVATAENSWGFEKVKGGIASTSADSVTIRLEGIDMDLGGPEHLGEVVIEPSHIGGEVYLNFCGHSMDLTLDSAQALATGLQQIINVTKALQSEGV
jgi:hypothetical protein